ncbi:MAG: GGDEF domain-containing protein [Acetobacterium sp.]|nr:GGDEF domain-containing protein [Acetobacterium sp.]
MDTNRISTNTKNHDANDNRRDQKKADYLLLKVTVSLLLYGMAIFLQMRILASGINLGGVLAQLQVIISTYLVVILKKSGYLIAVGLNLLVSAMVAVIVFGKGEMMALSGIIVPIGTITTISIILFYVKGLDAKLAEAAWQKEELSGLYDELAASEKKIIKQHIQLTEFDYKMKERETRNYYLDYIDVLTELPNRRMIVNRLELLLDFSRKNQKSAAVVFIDLDNFKQINRLNGYLIGDLLLKAMSLRIKGLLYEDDILGRLGGDEFAILIQHHLTKAEIVSYTEKIRKSLEQKFVIENIDVKITASLGIAFFPDDGGDAAEMLAYAESVVKNADKEVTSKNQVDN